MAARLTALLGRRKAIALLAEVVAALSVSELDTDEIARVAQSVATPSRVDGATVARVRATLRQCQAQEDGPAHSGWETVNRSTTARSCPIGGWGSDIHRGPRGMHRTNSGRTRRLLRGPGRP